MEIKLFIKDADEQKLANWISGYFYELRIQREMLSQRNEPGELVCLTLPKYEETWVTIGEVKTFKPFNEQWLHVIVGGSLIVKYPVSKGDPNADENKADPDPKENKGGYIGFPFPDLVRCKILQAGEGCDLIILSVAEGHWFDEFITELRKKWNTVWQNKQIQTPKKAGREPNPGYDAAYELIKQGKSREEAFSYWRNKFPEEYKVFDSYAVAKKNFNKRMDDRFDKEKKGVEIPK